MRMSTSVIPGAGQRRTGAVVLLALGALLVLRPAPAPACGVVMTSGMRGQTAAFAGQAASMQMFAVQANNYSMPQAPHSFSAHHAGHASAYAPVSPSHAPSGYSFGRTSSGPMTTYNTPHPSTTHSTTVPHPGLPVNHGGMPGYVPHPTTYRPWTSTGSTPFVPAGGNALDINCSPSRFSALGFGQNVLNFAHSMAPTGPMSAYGSTVYAVPSACACGSYYYARPATACSSYGSAPYPTAALSDPSWINAANPAWTAPVSAGSSTDTEANQLRDGLLRTTGERQDEYLARLREGKGSAFTDALAAAIPDLDADSQEKARAALAERLDSVPTAALGVKLRDGNAEVRRAAIRACAARADAKQVSALIGLLQTETSPGVASECCVVLKRLTATDLLLPADADAETQAQVARAWKEWQHAQEGR